MTAKAIFEQALALLNYTNAHGEQDAEQNAELYKRLFPVVNQIYADCFLIENPTGTFAPITSLSAIPAVSDKTQRSVMPFGVAMLIAQSENDGDSQSLYASLYNQARSGIPHPATKIKDVLPRGCDW